MVSLAQLKTSIGQMRISIVAERFVSERTRGGGQDGEWVEVYRFWGKVEWTKGNETLVAQKLQPFNLAYIIARWDQRLTTGMRLQIRGYKPINVRSCTNVEERNHILEIYADEGIGS